MGLHDTSSHRIPAIARPVVGQSYIDPVHGNRVWRVTDAASEGFPAIVPPYSNEPFLRTRDYGDLMLLYRKGSGGGHRLYHARPPFALFQEIPWGELVPDEPESVDCFGSLMRWMTFRGQIWEYDFDAGKEPEMVFEIRSPSNRVFGDTHGLPNLRRGGYSWYVSDLEKRLAVIDFVERRIVWEMPYFPPQVPNFQQRTGTPTMAVDGEYFVVPMPRQDAPGSWFYVFHFVDGVARYERILCADYSYEHSCQAQALSSATREMRDLYVSKTRGAPHRNPSEYIPGRETPESFLLLSTFETSTAEIPSLSGFLPLLSVPAWGSSSGTHLTGGSPARPSRIAFSCFAPSNATYRYDGSALRAGWQEIVLVDLDVAIATKGQYGYDRLCYHLSATQASNVFGNNGYWAEPHPMLSPGGDLVVFGSDFNFAKPESEWTRGIDTYVVEV